MNSLRIIVSVGLSSLFVTLINLFRTASFDFGGVVIGLILIGYGLYKINKTKPGGISFAYMIGFLSATSSNSLVLGILLATYSSPFLIADTVTIALDEVMTFNHWLSFAIGLIFIIKGFLSLKKSDK